MILLHLKDVLRFIVRKLSSIEGVKEIILFGSVARGDFKPFSDIDVIVIVDKHVDKRLIKDISADAYVLYGIPVTIIPIRDREKNPLYLSAISEGKVLWRREKR